MASKTRAYMRQELERAKGNLDWTATHIARCFEIFTETALSIAGVEKVQDIPKDHYQAQSYLNYAKDLGILLEMASTMDTALDRIMERL